MDGRFFLLLASISMTAFAGTWMLMRPAKLEQHSVEIVAQDKSGKPVVIESCAQAKAAGLAPLYAGRPGYRHELDPDGTGIACMN